MKLVHLKPKRLSTSAIRALEVLLEKAREGEISDFCYVAQCKGAWMYKSSTPEDDITRLSMVGMLEAVQQRLLLIRDWGKT